MFEAPKKTREKKKRRVLTAAVFLAVAGLAVGASVAVRYIGEDEVGKLGEYFRQLPLAQKGGGRVADEPGASRDGLPESERTGEGEEERAVTTPTPAKRYNLAVTIQYRRQPGFTLEISNLERTTEGANIQFYRVAEGNPYSILQILDERGQTIAEEKFQVATEALVDGLGRNINPVYALTDSVSRFVLALPPDREPAKVMLTTPQGAVLNERSFSWDELLSAGKKEGGWREVLFERFASWLLGTKQALGAGGWFNIVVISTPIYGPDGSLILPAPGEGVLSRVAKDIREVMLKIDPWSVYDKQVKVITVSNQQDMGCRLVPFRGGVFPLCHHQDQVQQVLRERGIGWSAVVIVIDTPCNCGTATLNSLMTAVGNQASGKLITHEFGHAVASMADEIYGDWGVRGPGGVNCFGSLPECQGILGKYKPINQADGVCSQGCNNKDTVRPANLMMYNFNTAEKFGPIERCFMGRAIAATLRETYEGDCGEEGPKDDSPTKDRGNWPGWYREY